MNNRTEAAAIDPEYDSMTFLERVKAHFPDEFEAEVDEEAARIAIAREVFREKTRLSMEYNQSLVDSQG